MANRTDTYKQKLRVILNDKEKAELGQEMADDREKVSQFKDELDREKTRIKAEVTALDARDNDICAQLTSGYEYRQVECERYFDYRESTVIETRLDTGEIVNTRNMTEQELQLEMDLIDGSEGDLDAPEVDEQAKTTTDDEPEPDRDDTEQDSVSDPYSDDIKALVAHLRSTKRASTNNIRRGLNWGYEKATRIMEEAEELGILGPPKGANPREILIELDEETKEGTTDND